MASNKAEGSARERLLAAANELFYEEGVHTVGIDRVIERAGVAKASLYSTFGSKDELVRAYLAMRHESRKERLRRHIARHDDARGRMLAIFDAQAEVLSEPSFRGCPFINASAEGPRESGARSVCEQSRAWVLDVLKQLARELGAADAERLAFQLSLLYDGATIAASMDRALASATEARAMAEILIDAAVGVKKPAANRSRQLPKRAAGKSRASAK